MTVKTGNHWAADTDSVLFVTMTWMLLYWSYFPSLSVYHYEVTVKTGNHWAADTDSVLFVTMTWMLLYWSYFPSLSVYHYEVTVKTGNHWAADTDSVLFITLIGDKGDTGRRRLFHSVDSKGDKFQKGQVRSQKCLESLCNVLFMQTLD